jgi:hypothetical protein
MGHGKGRTERIGIAGRVALANDGTRPGILIVGRPSMPNSSDVDEVGREALRDLVDASGPCVSIFLPTHRGGVETTQDPVRLKNLLRQAEEQLGHASLRTVEARELLEPARRLLDDYDFWQHQSDGLALYVAPGRFQSYRVPMSLAERVVVGEHFSLKPLLPLLTGNFRFYILALSQNHVRLLSCTPFRVEEVSLDGMPTSMEEAMHAENIEADSSYQVFGTSFPPSGAGSRAGVVFGRGRTDIDPKDRLQEYFRKIDAGICAKIKDQQAPLLLAAVEFHHPLYRQISSCAWLQPEGIFGNPEQLRPEQLLERALPLVEPQRLAERERDRANFHGQIGTGRASQIWAEIMPAVLQRRVEALFVAQRTEQWARLDPDTWSVELHAEAQPGDVDLLDFAAVQTWLGGARLHLVPPEEVPGEKAVAAVFRY